MTEKTIATTEPVEAPTTNGATGTREERRYLVPPVDIYETEKGLVVLADLPGVEPGGLEVKVDNGTLTIVGHIAEKEEAAGYREFALVDYFRQFRLHEQVDVEKIEAELKHGVLRVTLPHAEAAKPRQIQVKVA